MDGSLQPQHQELIDGSAISPEVAADRGYRSATTKADLERLGFSPQQRNIPGLLIPIRDVTGEIATYQLRPVKAQTTKKKTAILTLMRQRQPTKARTRWPRPSASAAACAA